MSRKIVVFTHDRVYPSNHGYRIDIARRIDWLRSIGFDVMVVSLSRELLRENDYTDPPGPQREFKELAFDRRAYLPPLLAYCSGLAPWPTVARRLRSDAKAEFEKALTQFDPNILLLEGLYGIELAYLARRIVGRGLPLLYRSHNIEHVYMRGQFSAAKDVRSKLNLSLGLIALSNLEKRAVFEADLVLDISTEDAAFWKAAGRDDVTCLPPLMPTHDARLTLDSAEPTWDVGYCGNLNAPNNVQAVLWFVERVWPKVQAAISGKGKLVLAGSRPSERIRTLGRLPGVHIVENPEHMSDIYAQTKVLINPALSGSGVNIKTIDMLSLGKPLILSHVAIAGLDPLVARQLHVASGVEDWVARTVDAVSSEEYFDWRPRDAYQKICSERYDALADRIARN